MLSHAAIVTFVLCDENTHFPKFSVLPLFTYFKRHRLYIVKYSPENRIASTRFKRNIRQTLETQCLPQINCATCATFLILFCGECLTVDVMAVSRLLQSLHTSSGLNLKDAESKEMYILSSILFHGSHHISSV